MQLEQRMLDGCQLVAVHCYALFFWKHSERRLFMVDINEENLAGTNVRSFLGYAEIIFGHVPMNHVFQMEVDSGGLCLTLASETEIAVVSLPLSVRTNTGFRAVKQIGCRSLFLDGNRNQLRTANYLMVRWLPDISKGSFLFALCDDNRLMVFNSDDDSPLAVVNLSQSALHFTPKFTKAEVTSFLIRKFDFGLPVRDFAKRTSVSYYWPVFAIKADGQLSFMLTNVHQRKFLRPGCLKLCPHRDDNYEMNVLDFACMTTCGVTVLLILADGGRVYHCLALQQKQNYEVIADPADAFYIYAYEILTINNCWGLSAPLADAEVALHIDPACQPSYFISHPRGVHEVTLPWIRQFTSTFGHALNTPSSFVTAILLNVQNMKAGKSPITSVADKGPLILKLGQHRIWPRANATARPKKSPPVLSNDFVTEIESLLQAHTFPYVSLPMQEGQSEALYQMLNEMVARLKAQLESIKTVSRILADKILSLKELSEMQGCLAPKPCKSCVEVKENNVRFRHKAKCAKFSSERIDEWLQLFRCQLCELEGVEQSMSERSLLAEVALREKCAANYAERMRTLKRLLDFKDFTADVDVEKLERTAMMRSAVERLTSIHCRLMLVMQRLLETQRDRHAIQAC
uniref:Nuclear pore complex protein Nup88 n=1 Tax=Trichuris muris TaxID=70415 RepID=A0A5S6Q1H6_TRIMR